MGCLKPLLHGRLMSPLLPPPGSQELKLKLTYFSLSELSEIYVMLAHSSQMAGHILKATLPQFSSKSNGHFSDFSLEDLLVTFNMDAHSFLFKTLSAIKCILISYWLPASLFLSSLCIRHLISKPNVKPSSLPTVYLLPVQNHLDRGLNHHLYVDNSQIRIS